MGYNSRFKVTVLNTGFGTSSGVSKFDILQNFKEYFKYTCWFDFPQSVGRGTIDPYLTSCPQKWYDHLKDIQDFVDKNEIGIYTTSDTILCVERYGEEPMDISRTYFKRGATRQIYEARIEFDDENVVDDFKFNTLPEW